MKYFLAALMLAGFSAVAKPKIENVKIQVFENKKDSPVTITVPFWVAQAGSELSDMIQIDDTDVDIKKIFAAIEKAPRLGTILTIEEKDTKIVVSIE